MCTQVPTIKGAPLTLGSTSREKTKKYAPHHKFVTFFSRTSTFLTIYKKTFFANIPNHTAAPQTQFVTVFHALRLSYFFLLRAVLNCSNKQFYGKRKNARSVRATRNVPSGFKTSDTKLFWWTAQAGLDSVSLPRFLSLPPLCVHFTAFAVARPCLCRGLSQGPSSPSRFCKNIARLWAPRRNRWLI